MLKVLSVLLGVVILGVVAAWLTLRGPDIPYETLEAKYADGEFAAAIPGARLITYRQVGHLPQIEIPQRSAADVAAFLETQPARLGVRWLLAEAARLAATQTTRR